MKPLIIFVFCVILIDVVSIVSCRKDNESNSTPVAKADDDVFLELNSCKDSTGSATLDGSGSFDPDSNIVSYQWRYLSGPSGFILRNSDSSIAKLENVSYGSYTFQLEVTDKQGLSSKTTVNVVATLKLHDMDLSVNGNYLFTDNYHYQDFYYDYFVDLTEITGKADFDSLGEFAVQLSEYSDTAAAAYSSWSTLSVYKDNVNNIYFNGNCSLNLKKLVQTGGGAFSGVVTLTYGTSDECNAPLVNLPPLNIAGNLDTATKQVTLQLQGKVRL